MSIYVTDELRLDVPEGYEDKTVNVLFCGERGDLNVTIARERRTDAALGDQTGALLSELERATGLKVTARRAGVAGHLPVEEARVQGHVDKLPVYQRQAHVDWFGTLVLVSVTAPRAARARCDALAGEILQTLRFRTP
jgi:hypothetical protein